MSLTDKLIKVNPEKLNVKQVKHYGSRHLKELMGAEKPVEITFQELTPERLNELMDGRELDKMSENYEICSMICVDSITDPNVKDPDLAKHFGASTPQKLVKKLFGFECNEIAGEVLKMAGITDDAEEKVKN